MKVNVIIENTTENMNLIPEHGLSMYIEYKGKSFLLDAGASGAFIENAEAMDVFIADVDYVVLSHGHYDHAGGFGRYLELNEDKRIYAMRSAVMDYYSGSGGVIHEIGIPKVILDAYMDNFLLIDSITTLCEDTYIIPHSISRLEEIGKRAKLYMMSEGELVPDNFSHELSLVFDTEKGLVIFNSCSHAGLMNIIEEVKAVFGDKQIYSFFGGLHMKGKLGDEVICTFSEEEIKKLSEYLEEAGLQRLYTGHCTGEPAIRLLKKYLGDKVDVLSTGKKICI